MWILLQEGGVTMWLILACAVLALIIFLERFFNIHRARIRTDDFVKGIFNILRKHHIPEAISLCEDTPGPVARMLRAAILNRNQSRYLIEEAVKAAGLAELGNTQRRLGILATTAQVAPLLGILGTFIGMIHCAAAIHAGAPLIQAGQIAGGLWQALLSSAAGVTVAILSYVGYNFLVMKLDSLSLDMERAASDIIAFFDEHPPVAEEK